MRALPVVMLALLVSACGAVPVVEPSISSSAAASPTTAATPRPSVDGHPLSEFLPTSIDGLATTTADLDPVNRNSPRVFLKVIGRLAETPLDGEVALAFAKGATVYAVRVAGSSATEVLMAYLAERGYPSAESPPTESVGGKQATRIGAGTGQFLYTSGDVFYYVNCASDALAADLLQQLP